METTRLSEENLAPLAFNLSIKSERIEKALYQNLVEPNNLTLFPVLTGSGVGVVGAGLLALFSVPTWLGVVLAAVPGYLAFKYSKRYFEGDYINARININRNLIVSTLDSDDAETLGRIAATIVRSNFGKEKWASDLKSRREQTFCDDYHYLAAIFTFAPACWHLCAAKVYELHATASKLKSGVFNS
ncbi:hypothetical protein [Pseudomonas sp. MWU12-2323]|uniref:hypothetical protein n=1 Tax=Pseudomonas sp. MWU12-2323 TaxID=2651296 RepID=UPI00128B208B|nr:hypothetical protein [Pseudomonas sp. MWU12-2323]MPQ69376.1 hypothetical protein [Pseudomonas sp. MWU12-2323]